MAVDLSTLQPFRPYSFGRGGATSFPPIYIKAATASTTYDEGDLVLEDAAASGQCEIINDSVSTGDFAGSELYGVVARKHTTGATLTEDDYILVYPALPGALFVGSFTDVTGAVDHAYTHANAATDANEYGVRPAASGSFPVIDQGDITDIIVAVHAIVKDQIRGQEFREADGVTDLNVRVLFTFKDSAFISALV